MAKSSSPGLLDTTFFACCGMLFYIRVSLYAKIWQLNNFKFGKFIRCALLPLTPLI